MPYINVDNIKTYYVASNFSDEKIPIIFIHGAGNTSHTWFNQLNLNIEKYFPLAIDLPGHGRSEGEGSDNIEGYSNFIYSFINKMDFKNVILAGHSMGGAIVQDFSFKFPEIVTKIILVATGAKLRVAQEILENTKLGYSYNYLAYSNKTDNNIIKEAESEFSLTNPMVRYNDFIACNNFDMMDKIDQINISSLIIVGSDDLLTPLKYANFLHDKLKNSRLIVINEAGHSVMWEKPKETNAAIISFLTDN